MVKVQWSHVGLCPVCFVKVQHSSVVLCQGLVQKRNVKLIYSYGVV